MRIIRNVILVLQNFRTSIFLLKFIYRGYLFDIGWIESRKKGMSIDKAGEPTPWLTYPFIEFLKSRLTKSMTIFEYGSGNSTLFYARTVKAVFSVENDSQWYNYIISKVPKNVTIFLETDESTQYVTSIKRVDQNFDIIVVDGRQRVNCIKSSIPFLKEDGVLILDNSNRMKYAEGIDFLLDNGFKRLDFWGLAPIAPNYTCTTLFYRSKNVFAI